MILFKCSSVIVGGMAGGNSKPADDESMEENSVVASARVSLYLRGDAKTGCPVCCTKLVRGVDISLMLIGRTPS